MQHFAECQILPRDLHKDTHQDDNFQRPESPYVLPISHNPKYNSTWCGVGAVVYVSSVGVVVCRCCAVCGAGVGAMVLHAPARALAENGKKVRNPH